MSEIFRKKSLDRVNSPEDLNEYMRVTNPPIWFALACIVLVLAGGIFWGMTAKLETTAKAVAVNTESGMVCYIGADKIADVKVGTTVRISEEEYEITAIGQEITLPNSALSDYEMSLADFMSGETVYPAAITGEAFAASSQATVVLEEISPVSFLLGSGD